MNVALISVGSVGDLLPFLALARALRARGCRTVMLTSTRYRALVESDGCGFESVMDDDSILGDPRLWHPISGLRLLVRTHVVDVAPRVVDTIARLKPDLIVCNNMIAGGFIAAESMDIPIASVCLQPYAIPSAVDTQRFSPWLDPLLGVVGPLGRRVLVRLFAAEVNRMLTPLNGLREAHGLAPWRDFMTKTRFEADSLLGLWPDWFCPRKADWPVRLNAVGFVDARAQERPIPSGSPLPDFLERRPLLFAMGSEMSQRFDQNVERFHAACRALGRSGLFVSPAIRGRGHVRIAPDFLVVESAPFTTVFPHVEAVVTHGGIGTLTKIMAAGKPAVVMPMAFDQFDNGHLITRAGLGAVVHRARALVPTLARVLDSKTIAAAVATARERVTREDGATKAASLLTARAAGVVASR